MFMHIFIEDLILQPPIGIQRAHHISGRILVPIILNDADEFGGAPGYSLVLVISHSTTAKITSTFYSPRLRPTNNSNLPKKDFHWSLLLLIAATIWTIIETTAVAHITNTLLSGCCSLGIANECPSIPITILLYALLLLSPSSSCDKSCCSIDFLDSPETNKCAATAASCSANRFSGANFVDKFTVRALYAGTLVVDRTTAPRHQQPPRRNYFQCQPYRAILLAALFLVLATLTIAARCYVSTNATGSIVQLSHTPNFYFGSSNSKANSPIHHTTHLQYYSTSQLQTSKIVLSSLFIKPRNENLQSDISVIDETYSKLFTTSNQNARIQQSHYHKQASKRRLKRRAATNSGVGVQASNRISTFQDTSFDASSSANSYLKYRTKQSKLNNIIYPSSNNHRFTVDIYKDNVYPTSAPNRLVTVPRLRNSAKSNSNNNPVILSIASGVQKNSAINNRSSASVYESTFDVGQHNSTIAVQQHPQSTISSAIDVIDHAQSLQPPDKRPMPPGHGITKDLLGESSGLLVLVAACLVLTLALGLVTCVLNHYRGGSVADPPDVAQTPTTAPMLSVVSAGATAGVGGMDRLRGRGAARELTTNRDHQVRLHTVHTDIAINLPPSISLPDGEDHPFSSRLHLRDTEQESEIYQKCIRPPPNRTVLESESPPPYRSNSAGLLGSIGGSSSVSSNDWSGGSAPLVVRCHSMSTSSVSSTKRADTAGSSGQKTDFIQKTVKIFTGKKSQPSSVPTLPPVVNVPTRTRRTADQQHLHLNHNHHHHQQQNFYHNTHPNHQTQQQQQQHQQNNSTSGRPNSNV